MSEIDNKTEPHFPRWQIFQAKDTLGEIPNSYSKKRAAVRGLQYGLVIGVAGLISPVLIPGLAAIFTGVELPKLKKAKKEWDEADRIVKASKA